MVTLKGLNQFWKRHGRQKDRMTVDDIRDGFVRVLDVRGRIEQYMFRQNRRAVERIGDRCMTVLQAIPAYFRDEEIVDVRDQAIRLLIQSPPSGGYRLSNTVDSGLPRFSLHGLSAEEDSPKSWIEVHRNGYVEVAIEFPEYDAKLGRFFASVAHSELFVSFAVFIRELYRIAIPDSPVLVRATFYNAKEFGLGVRSGMNPIRRWREDLLELGEFFVEATDHGSKLLPKRLADRLWNAYGLEESNVFDPEGNLAARR